MSKRVNSPELRFKEFSGEWEEKLFSNIFLFSSGKNIKQNEASPEFEIPCVRYGELYHLYNEVINKVINKTNLDKNDLLFSNGDEILLPSAGEDPLDIGSASALTLKNIAIGRTINILKPKQQDSYYPIFVSYYINQQLKRKISRLAKGSSISNVYNSDLKKLKINLPNKPEQQKIASFLTTIDTKIEQLTKKVELQEQYKKVVMQKIFNQEIRFRADDGSEFDEWEEKRLKDIATFFKGKSISKSDITKDGSLECIRYGELYTIYNETIKIIQSNTNLKKDDLVLSKYNDVLIPASGETQIDIATASCILKDNVALSGDLNIIRTKENGIFLAYYLNNFKKIDIARLSQGVSVIHLYNAQLKLLKINLPSLPEQTKLANFLLNLDKQIDSTKKQLAKTKEFKKGLLQRLFV